MLQLTSESEAYDVLLDEVEGHSEISMRAVCVIDDDRRIRYTWETAELRNDPDYNAVYEVVRDLESVWLTPT